MEANKPEYMNLNLDIFFLSFPCLINQEYININKYFLSKLAANKPIYMILKDDKIIIEWPEFKKYIEFDYYDKNDYYEESDRKNSYSDEFGND